MPDGGFLNPEEKKNRIWATSILNKTIDATGVSFPEFCYILDGFEKTAVDSGCNISTDGLSLFYDPDKVVRDFRKAGMKEMVRQLLHTMMHYLRGDIFDYGGYAHREKADLFLDAEVYRDLSCLGVTDASLLKAPVINAGYYQNKYDQKTFKELESYSDMIVSDDHSFWIKEDEQGPDGKTASGSGYGNSEKQKDRKKRWEMHIRLVFGKDCRDKSSVRRDLKKLLKKMEKCLRSGGLFIDDMSLEMGWDAVKSKRDYRDIVRSVLTDVITENESEEIYDRNMYCYGMQMYGDVPLIEPGEDEIDKKSIGRLAIAIDTSGSCCNEVAGRFLGEMARIIEDMRPYFRDNSDIVIFECDQRLRAEEHYDPDSINTVSHKKRVLHGGGGTSFCPVFKRIDDLIREEPDPQFNALIYLSDCYGTFPKKAPGYRVIFVTNEEGPAQVPDYVELASFR